MASNRISPTILEKQLMQKGYCTKKRLSCIDKPVNLFNSVLATVIKLAKHYQVNAVGQVPGAVTFPTVYSETKPENSNRKQ